MSESLACLSHSTVIAAYGFFVEVGILDLFQVLPKTDEILIDVKIAVTELLLHPVEMEVV